MGIQAIFFVHKASLFSLACPAHSQPHRLFSVPSHGQTSIPGGNWGTSFPCLPCPCLLQGDMQYLW